MERPRVLDEQAVEAAEFTRKNNQVKVATKMAAIGLGLTSHPLTKEEVSELAQDHYQLKVLACLSRIHVDSLKSAANQAKTPWIALELLEEATSTIEKVYKNPDFSKALRGTIEDHRGRQHFFRQEMIRDEAKVLEASSVLFPGRSGQYLIGLAMSGLLWEADNLPAGHPVKPLMIIEANILQAKQGKGMDVDNFVNSFTQLANLERDNNLHRVATVASWAVVWGERLGKGHLIREGLAEFEQITKQHPEWNFILDSERDKIKKQEQRKTIFEILAPIAIVSSPLTHYHFRRDKLYNTLTFSSRFW